MDAHSAASKNASNATSEEHARESLETTCCVVGGGPAGVVLALLLASGRASHSAGGAQRL